MKKRTLLYGLLLIAILIKTVLSLLDSQDPAKLPDTQYASEINLIHIFEGEINRSGKPVGFHSRPFGVDPPNARVVKMMGKPNREGVYTARVEIFDPQTKQWKDKFSSFFPDKMDGAMVQRAIGHAYAKRHANKKQPWQGPSGHGFDVQGYVDQKGRINTAFPVYKKDQ